MYSGFNDKFMIMIDFLIRYCIHMVFTEYS